jgi:hypothetical protein
MSRGAVSARRHKNQGSQVINPLTFALQGLQPGSSPIKIATQGFILEITPQPEPEPEPDGDEKTFYVPMTWSAAPRRRQDCVIRVNGCRATVSATRDNIAAGMPSTAELDELDDLFYTEQKRIEAEEDAIEAEEEIRFQCWEYFFEIEIEAELREKEAAAFRKKVAGIAAQLQGHDDPAEDIAAMLAYAFEETEQLQNQVTELENRLAAIESPQTKAKPKPAKRKK